MEISQFLKELDESLANFDFVNEIRVMQVSATYIKIKVTLKPKGFLNIWYNAIRRTQSFSLIVENKRIWGYDYDNRIGWHEHPVNNPDIHVIASSCTINEIVEKLKKVWNAKF